MPNRLGLYGGPRSGEAGATPPPPPPPPVSVSTRRNSLGLYGGPRAVGSFSVIDGPSGVYNELRIYDVSGLNPSALSWALDNPPAGYSIDDFGVVTYDGTRAAPGRFLITPQSYSEAGQAGTETVHAGYVDTLNLGVALSSVDPTGTLAVEGGVVYTVRSSWEVTNVPVGWSATANSDGTLTVLPAPSSAPGMYNVEWRYWDGNSVDAAGNGVVILGSQTVEVVGVGVTLSNVVITDIQASQANLVFDLSDAATVYAFVSLTSTRPSRGDLIAGTGAVTSASQAFGSAAIAAQLPLTGLAGGTQVWVHILATNGLSDSEATISFTTVAPGPTPIYLGGLESIALEPGEVIAIELDAFWEPDGETYAVSAGSLPPGLSIIDGLLTGSVSVEGTWEATIQANGTASATISFVSAVLGQAVSLPTIGPVAQVPALSALYDQSGTVTAIGPAAVPTLVAFSPGNWQDEDALPPSTWEEEDVPG